MGDDDKPFACPHPGCGMRFVNADHLTVHKEKHEMSLSLTPGTRVGAASGLFVDFSTDQTPTPTKFLRNCEEIGLFSELSSSKNPFEDAFKKAAQDNIAQASSEVQSEILVSIDGGTLNTPIPQADSSQAQPEYIPLPGPTSDSGSTLGSNSVSPVNSKQQEEVAIDLRVSSAATTPSSSNRAPTAPPAETLKVTPEETLSHVDVEHAPLPDSEDDVSIISSSSMSSVRTEEESPSSGVGDKYVVAGVPQPAVITSSAQETMTSPPVAKHIMTSPVNPQGGITIARGPVPIQPTQYLMQVMLQLPGGQTVPVNIPAAVSPTGTISSQSAIQVVPQQIVPQVHVKTEPLPSPQATPPPPQATNNTLVTSQTLSSVPVTTTSAVTEVSTTSNAQNTASAITKQKLKAAITQNVQQSVLQNNMRVMTEAVERVIASPAQRPQTLLKTQSSGGVLIQQPSLISPGSSIVQTQAADTSTPFGNKRTRKSSEDDPDERRRKFLERNRAAAARCRYKRKQWITNLERKADDMNGVNVKLQTEINQLRAEVAQLKSLLLAHKDCPIFVQQRNSGQINLETVNVQKMEVNPDGEQLSVPTKVTTLSLTPAQATQVITTATPTVTASAPGTQQMVSLPNMQQMVSPTIISVIDNDTDNDIMAKQS